jgi:uncharacterized protein (TIGR02594 family)
MPITRIITDIPPGEEENFVIALIRADSGSFVRQPQPDGKITIVATFDLPEPAPQFSAPGAQEPRWMAIARAELGVTEHGGSVSNQRIVAYHATTTLGPQPDHVHWCSSFVNFCITQAGLTGTNSALARSWATWGREAPSFIPGCIVVLTRGEPPSGHVGFFVGMDGQQVRLLGGNQGDAVSIASFEANRVIAKRLPASV